MIYSTVYGHLARHLVAVLDCRVNGAKLPSVRLWPNTINSLQLHVVAVSHTNLCRIKKNNKQVFCDRNVLSSLLLEVWGYTGGNQPSPAFRLANIRSRWERGAFLSPETSSRGSQSVPWPEGKYVSSASSGSALGLLPEGRAQKTSGGRNAGDIFSFLQLKSPQFTHQGCDEPGHQNREGLLKPFISGIQFWSTSHDNGWD